MDEEDRKRKAKEDEAVRKKRQYQAAVKALFKGKAQLKKTYKEKIEQELFLDKEKTGNLNANDDGVSNRNDAEQNEPLGMDTVGAIASSEAGSASSDDNGLNFALDEDGLGIAALDEPEKTMGTKNTAALMRAERNRAFYNALDERMDLLIQDIV